MRICIENQNIYWTASLAVVVVGALFCAGIFVIASINFRPSSPAVRAGLSSDDLDYVKHRLHHNPLAGQREIDKAAATIYEFKQTRGEK